MGRLNKPINENTTVEVSGITNSNICIFVDEYGNVTQTERTSKERLKFYIDPNTPQADYVVNCVIGINDAVSGECSYGIGLGIGDDPKKDFVRAVY